MANSEHLNLLQQGVDAWNEWRERNPEIIPDLSGTSLIEADFGGANLRNVTLSGADWYEATLNSSDLTGADLSNSLFVKGDFQRVDFSGANFSGAKFLITNFAMANFNKANLKGADLSGSIFYMTKLVDADLRGARLFSANLTEANLQGADLTGCSIYGISVWNVDLTKTKQEQLIVTRPNEPEIRVDNVEMAQFIYLLLNNQKIRSVIDTITSKVVLILDDSLQNASKCSTRSGMNYDAEATRRSFLILKFPPTGILRKQFPHWRTCPALSSLISPTRRAFHRNCSPSFRICLRSRSSPY